MISRWIALSLLLLSHFPSQSGHLIKKRSIMQFGEMIESYTGKKAMDFNGYGKYCGFGGSGEPVDAIDNCCMTHDKCYHSIQHLCFFLSPKVYILHYGWILNKSGIICYNRNLCKKWLCHCDSIAARCFAKNLKCYNPKYLSFWAKVFQTLLEK